MDDGWIIQCEMLNAQCSMLNVKPSPCKLYLCYKYILGEGHNNPNHFRPGLHPGLLMFDPDGVRVDNRRRYWIL